jgi:hypothetical protein
MAQKIGETDTEKWANEMLICRQIVGEVLRFGVDQRQILNIIKLLAMELEDREALVAISAITSEALEEASGSSKIITEPFFNLPELIILIKFGKSKTILSITKGKSLWILVNVLSIKRPSIIDERLILLFHF